MDGDVDKDGEENDVTVACLKSKEGYVDITSEGERCIAIKTNC